MGLRGSKGSAYEGGIRVPAIIYYKGVLEKAKSSQFIFVDDILPTILSALNIRSNSGSFTGIDHWANLITNNIVPPDNADRYGLSLRYKIMPEYLKEAGYQTALSGKWHLGMFADEYLPLNRGFDSTYGHLGGGIGYFDHALFLWQNGLA